MPAGDRTGPWGLGSRTGRGLGYCSGYQAPGYMAAGPGMGFGRGYGRGLGFGRGPGRGLGFGRGRGFRRFGAGRFWGYPIPPDVPYGYPGDIANVPPADEESYLAEEAGHLEEELGLIRKRMDEIKKAKEKKRNEK
jgi:hypothetical protein